ncbi:predicted protein [Aspergillus terreus NIH2624]|uniref:Ketoreductase domain-containing protein n=1 Tax=Aspergillus terreus (strain NIH 2624 / FGSC A1156) TaxID=341663 RepID=Q0CPZ5_ASPTN|nr:uncharacterized protein ATEG_04239 [Aspergillus terreus NIH2624]EAU36041.1 predicted protein [Aspergillus terreus NIH2624]
MLSMEDSSRNGSIRTRETALELFTLTHRTIIGEMNLNSTLAYEIFMLDPVLVTGSVGGMGLALIQTILELGADVVAIDRVKRAEGEAWGRLQGVAKSNACNLTYFQSDISSFENTLNVFQSAISQARYPLRGLVHCAAIGWVGDSLNFSVKDARQIIDVNLVGTLIVAQVGARLVQEQQKAMTVPTQASFVFIASMSGYVVNKGTPNAAYAASKAGVQQLARNLASEWGPSIRVNTISPGVIRTPMTNGILESKRELCELWTRETMLGRLSEPQDYQGPAAFLLSDSSAYVTVADLLVDAGYTAW